MLRHTKISTTQGYAKVTERKLSDDMQLLKQKLTKKSVDVAEEVVQIK